MPQKKEQQIVPNNLIDTIKKEQIINEISKANPSIPEALLDFIWDSVKKLPEQKLKQIKKGQFKVKKGHQRITRREYKDGETIKACDIDEEGSLKLKPVNMILPKEDNPRLEYIGEDAVEEKDENRLAPSGVGADVL